MVRQTSTSEFYAINDILVDKAEAILGDGSGAYPAENAKGLEWFRELSANGDIPVVWESRRFPHDREMEDLGLSLLTPKTLSLESLMNHRPLACVADNKRALLLWKDYCAEMRIPLPFFADGSDAFVRESLSLLSGARTFPARDPFVPDIAASEIRREVIRVAERCVLRSLLATMVGTRKKTLYVMEHDKLTGILNRHGGEQAWKKLDREVRESGRRYVFFIADLDHFKKVNDHFGHDYGDEVLSKAASALAQSVGKAGFVYRFGGEEIAGFRKVRHFFDQQRFASQIMHAIRDLNLPAPPGTGEDILTVSVGITIFDPELNNVPREDILKQADMALYAAKEAGRNGYEVFVMNRKFMNVPLKPVRTEGPDRRLEARMTTPI